MRQKMKTSACENLWCCLRYTGKNKPRQELIHAVAMKSSNASLNQRRGARSLMQNWLSPANQIVEQSFTSALCPICQRLMTQWWVVHFARLFVAWCAGPFLAALFRPETFFFFFFFEKKLTLHCAPCNNQSLYIRVCVMQEWMNAQPNVHFTQLWGVSALSPTAQVHSCTLRICVNWKSVYPYKNIEFLRMLRKKKVIISYN